MPLTTGARLGPYEILAPIGAGGMGEVYRARDTRLDRTVAVKVLPTHLADSAESRQRFEREARSISQLSHPHICALYDVGHEGSVEYLVMEHLEGETLAARLGKGGALPLEQTLRYGVQIAQALDGAHRQGIVHRDLKPANVMLTKSGVKLLDFGLARTLPSPPGRGAGGEGETALSTLIGDPAITEKGTVLGTFQYMAPEQLEGRDADARSDIFAFGAVLYEMASGRKAFVGSSQASLISAILRDEPPPVSQVAPTAPPSLDRLIRTCLAKNPDERWQSAHDLAAELEWIRQAASESSGARSGEARPATAPRARRVARLAWAFVAFAVGAAAATLYFSGRHPSSSHAPLSASLLPPEGARFDLLSGPPALSPDGTRVAFVGRTPEGRSALYVRALDSDGSTVVPGTESASSPFWSPDGRTLGYSTGSTVELVPVSGGVPDKLANFIRARGFAWSAATGTILIASGNRQAMYRCSLADRKLEVIHPLGDDDLGFQSPQFLPDGRHYIYLARRVDRATRAVVNEIRVADLDAKKGQEAGRALFLAESNAVYAPPGYLLFLHERNLVARRFDPRRLELSGDSILVARRVASSDQGSIALFSVSETGRIVWAEGEDAGLSQLAVYDPAGKRTAALGAVADLWTPRLSHDGMRVAVELVDPASANRDIWIYDVSRPSIPVRLTFDPGEMATPVWSPDDSRIAYLHRDARTDPARPQEWSIRIKTVAGERKEEIVHSATRTSYLTGWSSDGAFLTFNRTTAESRNDVFLLSLADRKTRTLVGTPAEDRDAVFSPDGRWIAYMSGQSGRWEIYVEAFPGPGGKRQISAAGGLAPRWRADGKALFYLTLDGRLMSVPVRTTPSFEADEPRVLFTPRLRRTLIAQYDVFPDGQRFLVNALATVDVTDSLHVADGWPALVDAAAAKK